MNYVLSPNLRHIDFIFGSESKLRFSFRDERGICLISDVSNSPLDTASLTTYSCRAWSFIRSRMDSTSGYCDCSAMDYPFALRESNMHDTVVQGFILALEDITDCKTYDFEKNSPHGTRLQLKNDASVRSNVIYFERFLDMFHDEVNGDVQDYRSQIRCR